VTTPRPVEVVGGGVGGLALGLALRRSGVPVTLFEAGDYPRHRVCGEFIAGLSGTTVEALGLKDVLADCTPHRAVTYIVRGQALPSFALPGTAWGISRHTLDHRLARAFVAAAGTSGPTPASRRTRHPTAGSSRPAGAGRAPSGWG
jgi:2-polyprenyl-6-methoxyphenol hydroxylase-like FAD-dependent oxidoreductase